MMLYTKYQGSRPCGFRKEDFSCFPYIRLSKICDPGRAHFWPQGHILNNLGRGPLGDATYQKSGFRPCGFRQEDFTSIHLENLFLACET